MGKIQKTNPEKLGLVSSLLSVGQWSWDKVAALAASAAGAGIMAWLASLTTWIHSYGPIAWGAVGLITFLTLIWSISSAQALIASSMVKRAHARITDKIYDTALINPLEQNFMSKRISLYDLRTPMGEPVKNKVFNQCELIGPAVILLNGGGITGNSFHYVEFSKIKNEFRAMPNKLVLEHCQLVNCKIYNVIFLVPEQMVDALEKDMPNIQWITS